MTHSDPTRSERPPGAPDVDPITLAVVRGALETAQREMTLTMERTGRSSVLTVSRDFSNAIFNWTPEMIVQGQDLPIHLGSLIMATKAVARYFEGDVRPGDVMFHNDPMWDGSHIADWCMYKPVFIDGRAPLLDGEQGAHGRLRRTCSRQLQPRGTGDFRRRSPDPAHQDPRRRSRARRTSSTSC